MIKNNYLGKFIVLEGLDGSGKSAQVELLVDFLKERGIANIYKTFEIKVTALNLFNFYLKNINLLISKLMI